MLSTSTNHSLSTHVNLCFLLRYIHCPQIINYHKYDHFHVFISMRLIVKIQVLRLVFLAKSYIYKLRLSIQFSLREIRKDDKNS